MNIISASRVAFEPLRILDFSEITDSSYTLVGSTFVNPVRMLKVYNDTNAVLIVSYNGISDHDYLPAGGSGYIYDYGANQSSKAGLLDQPALLGVWVKYFSSAPTSGQVAVVDIYASQGGQG